MAISATTIGNHHCKHKSASFFNIIVFILYSLVRFGSFFTRLFSLLFSIRLYFRVPDTLYFSTYRCTFLADAVAVVISASWTLIHARACSRTSTGLHSGDYSSYVVC